MLQQAMWNRVYIGETWASYTRFAKSLHTYGDTVDSTVVGWKSIRRHTIIGSKEDEINDVWTKMTF